MRPSELTKGYLILVLCLLVFGLWGMNLFSLSEIEIDEAAPDGTETSTTTGGSVTTVTVVPRPFLYFYFRELGYRAEGRFDPPTSTNDLFVLIDPDPSFPAELTRRTMDWVRRGGTLVLFLPQHHAAGETLGSRIADRPTATPPSLDLRFSWLKDVHALSASRPQAEILPGMSFISPFSAGTDRPSVLLTYRGKGRVFILSNPDLLEARGLREYDNLTFVTRIAERFARADTLYFHDPGVSLMARVRTGGGAAVPMKTKKVKSPYLSLWSLIKANPISWVFPQILVGLGLYFHSRGRRFGRAIALVEGNKENLSYLDSMGSLLHEQGAWHFAAQRLYEKFTVDAKRRFALAPADGNFQILERVAVTNPDLSEQLKRAFQDMERILGGSADSEMLLMRGLTVFETLRKEFTIHG